jgi:hypothetical protein
MIILHKFNDFSLALLSVASIKRSRHSFGSTKPGRLLVSTTLSPHLVFRRLVAHCALSAVRLP